MFRPADLRERFNTLAPDAFRSALLVILALTIALFPLGRAVQTLGPVLCGVVLVILYIRDWKRCALRRLPVRWLFGLFVLALLVQVAGSHWVPLSWQTVSPNLYRGYVLVFAALEAVSSERDLKWLVAAFVVVSIVAGLDGIWQYATGVSLIRGEPIHRAGTEFARLTGSLGGPRAGDFMALLLLPASAAWYLLPARLGRWRAPALLALLTPGLFLCIGAQARSGYLALFFGIYVVLFFILRKPDWRAMLPLAGFIALILYGPARVSIETAAQDGRIPIWTAAWKTFLASPWFGFGAGTFTPAHTLSQGYLFLENGGDVQHPHNAYLQWLTEGGVFSFACFAIFFGGMLFWTLWRVYKGVQEEQRHDATGSLWRQTAFFWAGFLGYLVINMAGHSFYRTWLVTLGMTLLGIVLGVCAHNPISPPPHNR